eukprot:COSAG06_NODE_31247_length_524_cov_1.821176_1_plen_58_part_10
MRNELGDQDDTPAWRTGAAYGDVTRRGGVAVPNAFALSLTIVMPVVTGLQLPPLAGTS